MNIKITHNWLLEYLDTNVAPQEIQKYLSLSGPSVEKIEKVDDDYVYDVEITSNRVDAASVFGIAQEAQAIVPHFAKKAKLKFDPLKRFTFSSLKLMDDRITKLDVKIADKNTCSRFTAIVLDNIKISPSPDFISKRLQLCGIKSINNVIDISNYLMIALGQPVHVFDYDEVGKQTMVMRESQKGEKIITLDGKEITLPGGDIVIADRDGRLIDLCGIMGGLNSSVSNKTKRVVLFVQTYNAQKIRRTSMLTGQRTVAASYFEKGLDEERVELTTAFGIELLQKYANAKIASKLYDIYPNPYKAKSISISIVDVYKIIGVPIAKDTVVKILTSLGFRYHHDIDRSKMVTFEVPSWRSRDVSIKEDLIEEIARIYGYHNLPNNIQPTVYVKQPKEVELMFDLQSKIKFFLKHLGLHEVMNYSMISKKMIDYYDLTKIEHLRIQNPISEDIEFLRRNLIVSLIKNIKDNEGKREELKFFEIAKTYTPQVDDLPIEIYKLGIAVNTSFADLKGIIEAVFKELHIDNYKVSNYDLHLFDPKIQAKIMVGNDFVGELGKLNVLYKDKEKLKSDVYIGVLFLSDILEYYKSIATYHPINPYAEIKLDLTIVSDLKQSYQQIKERAYQTSKLLTKLEAVNVYKNKVTLRFYFSSTQKNITEEEAKKELENIIKSIKYKR